MQYVNQFEKLEGMIEQVSPTHLLQKFLGGLKEEIKFDVIAANPQNFDAAVSLAKTFETKWLSANKYAKQNFLKNNIKNSSGHNQESTSSKPTKIKTLTPEEILDKKKKNLCFGCNEKYHYGHKCKTKQIYTLEGIVELDNDSDSDDIPDNFNTNHLQLAAEDNDTNPGHTLLSISINSLLGIPTLHTIIVKGSINNKNVILLIDSGSTHSFIDSKLVQKLKLQTAQTKPYEV